MKISSALNHRILNSGEFRNQFGGHVVVDDEDFSDISKLPPPPLPPGITLPPPPPPPAMVLEEEFELDDTIELTETDIGEEISEESNDFQAQWEKRRSSDPSMVTDSKDSMYGHIDRIATGDVGTLLDRFSDRFGSELDREIIVLRKQQQQDIRAVKPTVELVSAPTIEIDERDIDDELKAMKKITKGTGIDPEVTTRMKKLILAIDGERSRAKVNKFIDEQFLSRDSLEFRKYLQTITPDVDMTYNFECSLCTYIEEMTVPMTVQFLWPAARV